MSRCEVSRPDSSTKRPVAGCSNSKRGQGGGGGKGVEGVRVNPNPIHPSIYRSLYISNHPSIYI